MLSPHWCHVRGRTVGVPQEGVPLGRDLFQESNRQLCGRNHELRANGKVRRALSCCAKGTSHQRCYAVWSCCTHAGHPHWPPNAFHAAVCRTVGAQEQQGARHQYWFRGLHPQDAAAGSRSHCALQQPVSPLSWHRCPAWCAHRAFLPAAGRHVSPTTQARVTSATCHLKRRHVGGQLANAYIANTGVIFVRNTEVRCEPYACTTVGAPGCPQVAAGALPPSHQQCR